MLSNVFSTLLCERFKLIEIIMQTYHFVNLAQKYSLQTTNIKNVIGYNFPMLKLWTLNNSINKRIPIESKRKSVWIMIDKFRLIVYCELLKHLDSVFTSEIQDCLRSLMFFTCSWYNKIMNFENTLFFIFLEM